MTKTILSIFLVEYLVPSILFCLLLTIISYFIWVILKARSEKQMKEEISIIQDHHQLKLDLLNRQIASSRYRDDKKREIDSNLFAFFQGANFKLEDDMQNAIMSILMLKQMTKAMELIVSEEDRCRFSEYEALREMANRCVSSNLPELQAELKSTLILFKDKMRKYLRDDSGL